MELFDGKSSEDESPRILYDYDYEESSTSSLEDESQVSSFDIGQSPPKTRTSILRKRKQSKITQHTSHHKNLHFLGGKYGRQIGSPKKTLKLFNRRHKIVKAVDSKDEIDSSGSGPRLLTRQRKRTVHLHREWSRDEKMSSQHLERNEHNSLSYDYLLLTPKPHSMSTNDLSSLNQLFKHQQTMIQTKNRFTSLLSCKPIQASSLVPHTSHLSFSSSSHLTNRIEFFKSFESLTKKRNSNSKEKSQEENIILYANPSGDMIWLELQAWFASRDVMAQDAYITKERKRISKVISDILTFKFQVKDISEICKDETALNSLQNNSEDHKYLYNHVDVFHRKRIEIMNKAIKDVKHLLESFERVENYYASTRIFRLDYPIIGLSTFESRIKSLSYWLNVTQMLRDKIDALGNWVKDSSFNSYNWPIWKSDYVKDENSEISSSTTTSTSHSSTSSLSETEKWKNTYKVSFDVLEKKGTSNVNVSHFNSYNQQKVFNSSNLLGVKNSEMNSSSSYLRHYAEKSLKTKGLRKLMNSIHSFTQGICYRAQRGLQNPKSLPIHSQNYSPIFNRDLDEELLEFETWNSEFNKMSLPSFRASFLFLSRFPWSVIHECLKIRLEQKPLEPSELSLEPLLRECKEALRLAVREKRYIDVNVNAAIFYDRDSNEKFLKAFKQDMTEFDGNLSRTLQVYLSYLQSFVRLMSSSSMSVKHLLDEEWNFMKSTSVKIPDGILSSANKFCMITEESLKDTGVFMRSELESVLKRTLLLLPESSENETFTRHQVYEVCRGFQAVFHKVRERSLKVLSFAKTLRNDLEVCFEFNTHQYSDIQKILEKLHKHHFVQIQCSHDSQYHLFISANINNPMDFIHQLLSNDIGYEYREPGILILMKSSNSNWPGDSLALNLSEEINEFCSQIETESDFLLFPSNPLISSKTQSELFDSLRKAGLQVQKNQRAIHVSVQKSLNLVKMEAILLGEKLFNELEMIDKKIDIETMTDVEPFDKEALFRRLREIFHQAYKFGFEFYKDLHQFVSEGELRGRMMRGLFEFSKQWIAFVLSRCERGKGSKPRWAIMGICFLLFVSSPNCTRSLSNDDFLIFKALVEKCYSHIIGEFGKENTNLSSSSSSSSFIYTKGDHFSSHISRFNSRASSPIDELIPPILSPRIHKKKTLLSDNDSKGLSWNQRVQRSIESLERFRDERGLQRGVIGRHLEFKQPGDTIHIKSKTVSFSWQKGVKIGQGHFGKVYTAINNETGDIMALKEIPLQPNDHKTLRTVADELRIFENIHHQHIINHYGVEVHRDEMLIFMEFCPEGTLENYVLSTENGIGESSVRRYTRQLMEAVSVLHENQIVHRDIKGANIFLTDEMRNLKLGDFGCAVKIKAHTTMPGELQGFVGTQAYMAPEVFTKNLSEGYGRAADIWSVGCVVIEMTTGHRPWHELESNYQIMFKVGMGEAPKIPSILSNEGREFLTQCFEHEPVMRASAEDLLIHSFLKIYDEEETVSTLVSESRFHLQL